MSLNVCRCGGGQRSQFLPHLLCEHCRGLESWKEPLALLAFTTACVGLCQVAGSPGLPACLQQSLQPSLLATRHHSCRRTPAQILWWCSTVTWHSASGSPSGPCSFSCLHPVPWSAVSIPPPAAAPSTLQGFCKALWLCLKYLGL